uniref:Myosin_tail_1 domain-containing protein n=1 Tax=Rhabditophanes sp. KR3021 TaxID=114890 RepID=A0AC35TTM6_9BILA
MHDAAEQIKLLEQENTYLKNKNVGKVESPSNSPKKPKPLSRVYEDDEVSIAVADHIEHLSIQDSPRKRLYLRENSKSFEEPIFDQPKKHDYSQTSGEISTNRNQFDSYDRTHSERNHSERHNVERSNIERNKIDRGQVDQNQKDRNQIERNQNELSERTQIGRNTERNNNFDYESRSGQRSKSSIRFDNFSNNKNDTERLNARIESLENIIYERNAEIRDLTKDKTNLERKMYDYSERVVESEDKIIRERRTMMEENGSLRKRLDNLTPLMAQKESLLQKALAEKDTAESQLVAAKQETHMLHIRFEERSREKQAFSDIEIGRRNEIERLNEKIRELDTENSQIKVVEQNLIDQISSLNRKIKEDELRIKKERSFAERVSDDNNNLIKDNSTLTSQIGKLAMMIEQLEKELSAKKGFEIQEKQFMELRQRELDLRSEIRLLEDKLYTEHEKVSALESKIKQKENDENKIREDKMRIQREFEGLSVLSTNLSSENKTIRDEKLNLEDRIAILEKTIRDKEMAIVKVKEENELLNVRHSEVIEKMRKEIFAQAEKGNEYEALCKRLRELSESASKLHSRENSTIKGLNVISPRVSFENELITRPDPSGSMKDLINYKYEGSTITEMMKNFSEMIRYDNSNDN